jgi:transposase
MPKKGRTLSEKPRTYTKKEAELLSRKGYSAAELAKMQGGSKKSAYTAAPKPKKKNPTRDLSAMGAARNIGKGKRKPEDY